MKNYIDIKVQSWKRFYLPDNLEKDSIINTILNVPSDLSKYDSRYLTGTETIVKVDDDSSVTVELYQNDICVWDNSDKNN
jgi:hypothetical protein